MHRFARRVLFWIFVCSFFIVASAVSVYSLGYRWSPERGIFVYTGSITIKTNPLDVTMKIDGEPVDIEKNRINNSYHIGGLRPGEHLVEISAPDHLSWSKKIHVTSGLSTEFWNIILPRQQYEDQTLPVSGVAEIFPAPESTLLAYSGTRNDELFVGTIDTDTNTAEQVFSLPRASLAKEDKENIEWSIDSNRLIIPVRHEGRKEYFIVNTETKAASNFKDIALVDTIQAPRWDSSRNNLLYFLSNGNLYQINLDQPLEKRLLAQSISNYDISGDTLYVLELPGGIVYRFPVNNPGSRTQISTAPPADLSDSRYSLIVYDEDRVALLNYHTGNLFALNKGKRDNYFNRLASDARGAQFSDDGKKLLFWNDWEIFVYFTRDWEVQPVRLENTTIGVSRFSQPVRNIHWAKDYEHIIFSAGTDIKMIELDQRERSLVNILTLPAAPLQILNNFTENELIYILPSDSENNARFIVFPERTTFFGFGE